MTLVLATDNYGHQKLSDRTNSRESWKCTRLTLLPRRRHSYFPLDTTDTLQKKETQTSPLKKPSTNHCLKFFFFFLLQELSHWVVEACVELRSSRPVSLTFFFSFFQKHSQLSKLSPPRAPAPLHEMAFRVLWDARYFSRLGGKKNSSAERWFHRNRTHTRGSPPFFFTE